MLISIVPRYSTKTVKTISCLAVVSVLSGCATKKPADFKLTDPTHTASTPDTDPAQSETASFDLLTTASIMPASDEQDDATSGSETKDREPKRGNFLKRLFKSKKKPISSDENTKVELVEKTKDEARKPGLLSKIFRSKKNKNKDEVDTTLITGNIDEDGMTLKNVLITSIKSHPDLLIAQAREREGKLGIKIAQTDYLPSVDVSASTGQETSLNPSNDSYNIRRTEANIQLNQTLYDFGATKNSVERRKAIYDSLKMNTADAAESITFDILSAYLNYLKQSDLAYAAKENIRSLEEMARIIRLGEEAGNNSVADVQRVETRLDGAKSSKLNFDNSRKDAETAFKRLTNVNPQAVKRPKDLQSITGRRFAKSSGDVDYHHLIAQNPKLKAIAADKASLERQLKQQRSALLPELFAMGEANYKENAGGDTGIVKDYRVMFGFRFKLFDGGKQIYTSEQISARIAEADAKQLKLHRDLLKDYENNSAVLETSKEKSRFLSDALTSAKKVSQLYNEQFSAGIRTPFELLDAQRDLFRAEQDAIAHRYDKLIANYKELRLKGELSRHLGVY